MSNSPQNATTASAIADDLITRYGEPSLGETLESGEKKQKSNFMTTSVPTRTDPSGTFKTHHLINVAKEDEQLSNMPLMQSSLKKEINAVVSRLTNECVFVNCLLPNDTVELSLPRGIVNPELALYGTPVSISIEVIDGYRQPVIKARSVENNPHYTKELQEIDKWLDTL